MRDDPCALLFVRAALAHAACDTPCFVCCTSAAQFYRQHGIEWPTVTVEYSNLNVSMEVSELVDSPGLIRGGMRSQHIRVCPSL
jgi:hypothetical protein